MGPSARRIPPRVATVAYSVRSCANHEWPAFGLGLLSRPSRAFGLPTPTPRSHRILKVYREIEERARKALRRAERLARARAGDLESLSCAPFWGPSESWHGALKHRGLPVNRVPAAGG